MVTSYPLPEGFSELDVFSLGSCLLVEGKKTLLMVPVQRSLTAEGLRASEPGLMGSVLASAKI